MYHEIVTTLRARRESLKLDCKQVSLEMGIERQTLVKLESGICIASIVTLCNWCRALGLTLGAR